MPGTISVEARGRVLLATLANPPHALLDTSMVQALEALVARAEEDPDVGAVVLTGAHPARFIAHYDVAELLAGAEAAPTGPPRAMRVALAAVAGVRRVPRGDRAIRRTPAGGVVDLERFQDVLVRMGRSGAVFVAAMNGSALGGGCELALACDVRLMARGPHHIGQPEILFGFSPGGGGTQRLARLLGSAKALRIVLEGAPIAAEDAAALGLVDRLVEGEALLEEAVSEAARLGSRAKAAVGACKRAVYGGGSLPLAAGLRLEQAEFLSAMGRPEARAAMRAYVAGLERTGELPLYDTAAVEATLETGRFA